MLCDTEIEALSSPTSNFFPVETILHPRRLETGTSNFPFPIILNPFEIPFPTDTSSLFHKLLIYLRVWKPVARNFYEIIGFNKRWQETLQEADFDVVLNTTTRCH
jgi:hypothetical protein